MRKILFISILTLIFVSFNSNAQTYKINKLHYDYHNYIPEINDPYNPALCGVCSFLVPGLGQMIAGETGRGAAFLAGSVSCSVIMLTGWAEVVSSINNSTQYNISNNVASGGSIMLIGALGAAIIDIWSIVDAVNVAKVNNMYIQDLRKKTSMKFELSPYVAQIQMSDKMVTPVGLSMKITF